MARILLIGAAEKQRLADLVRQASLRPVDMTTLAQRIQTPEGKDAHMRRMTQQTVGIPSGFLVTFSIEDGHPCGRCRHMSVSLTSPTGRLPHPIAVWEIAGYLGFTGSGLEDAVSWLEKTPDFDAINVVQPVGAAVTRPPAGREPAPPPPAA